MFNTSKDELEGNANEHLYLHQKLVRVLTNDGLDCAYWISTDPRCLWNTAFFCPGCGETWARSLVNASANPHWAGRSNPDTWRVDLRRCEKCGDGTLVNWSDPIMLILELYCKELLERELKIWQPK